MATWEQQGVPAITALIDDVTTAERNTADPTTTTAAGLSATTAKLGPDLATANRLATPPAAAAPAPALWRRAIADLVAAVHHPAAAVTLSPAAVSLAHQQFAAAGNELLEVSQYL